MFVSLKKCLNSLSSVQLESRGNVSLFYMCSCKIKNLELLHAHFCLHVCCYPLRWIHPDAFSTGIIVKTIIPYKMVALPDIISVNNASCTLQTDATPRPSLNLAWRVQQAWCSFVGQPGSEHLPGSLNKTQKWFFRWFHSYWRKCTLLQTQ